MTMTSPQSPGLRPDEQAAGWTAGPMTRERLEGLIRQAAHSIPPSDAGSTRAIRAITDAVFPFFAAQPAAPAYAALKALELQALQSPDLISTEWGQEALSAARAALASAVSHD